MSGLSLGAWEHACQISSLYSFNRFRAVSMGRSLFDPIAMTLRFSKNFKESCWDGEHTCQIRSL